MGRAWGSAQLAGEADDSFNLKKKDKQLYLCPELGKRPLLQSFVMEIHTGKTKN